MIKWNRIILFEFVSDILCVEPTEMEVFPTVDSDRILSSILTVAFLSRSCRNSTFAKFIFCCISSVMESGASKFAESPVFTISCTVVMDDSEPFILFPSWLMVSSCACLTVFACLTAFRFSNDIFIDNIGSFSFTLIHNRLFWLSCPERSELITPAAHE